jgi:hypothetical protein
MTRRLAGGAVASSLCPWQLRQRRFSISAGLTSAASPDRAAIPSSIAKAHPARMNQEEPMPD